MTDEQLDLQKPPTEIEIAQVVYALNSTPSQSSLALIVRRLVFDRDRLKGTIDAQDERERNAGEKCGVPYEQHGCDWPDWVAERLVAVSQSLETVRELRRLRGVVRELRKRSRGYSVRSRAWSRDGRKMRIEEVFAAYDAETNRLCGETERKDGA